MYRILLSKPGNLIHEEEKILQYEGVHSMYGIGKHELLAPLQSEGETVNEDIG